MGLNVKQQPRQPKYWQAQKFESPPLHACPCPCQTRRPPLFLQKEKTPRESVPTGRSGQPKSLLPCIQTAMESPGPLGYSSVNNLQVTSPLATRLSLGLVGPAGSGMAPDGSARARRWCSSNLVLGVCPAVAPRHPHLKGPSCLGFPQPHPKGRTSCSLTVPAGETQPIFPRYLSPPTSLYSQVPLIIGSTCPSRWQLAAVCSPGLSSVASLLPALNINWATVVLGGGQSFLLIISTLMSPGLVIGHMTLRFTKIHFQLFQ